MNDQLKLIDEAHEVWAAAQLAPGEGIEDGVARVQTILSRISTPNAQPEQIGDDMQALSALADRIEHANGAPIPISVEGAAAIRALLSRHRGGAKPA